MRISLWKVGSTQRRVWPGVAGIAIAALVAGGALGFTTMAERPAAPMAAPELALVGETSTPTSSAPPPTVAPTATAPTPTGGPTPSGGPTPPPSGDGPCVPLVGFDEGSERYRAMIDCGDGSSIDILPRQFQHGGDAEAYAEVVADWRNSGHAGLPVMDGPGCKPPLVLC